MAQHPSTGQLAREVAGVPQTAEHEERNVRQYVESQLHDDEDGVTLVQHVGQERVAGTTHLMYDVHTIKGRWWVITEPTNLYDQVAFPEIDYTFSFHLGLRLRIHEKGRVEVEDERREHAGGSVAAVHGCRRRDGHR